MEQNYRKKLAERRLQIAEDAASQVISGKEDDLNPIRTKLDAISKIQAILPARKKLTDRTGVVLIALFVILVAFLWINKKSTNALQLDIQSKTLEMQIREDWHLDDPFYLNGGLLNIEGMQFIRNPVLGVDLQSMEAGAWVQIKADTFRLVRLYIAAGKNLAISIGDNRNATVVARGPKMQGRIEFFGNVELYAGIDDQIEAVYSDVLDYPEAIDFMIENNDEGSSTIEFPTSEPWSLSGICVDSLVFGREEPGINDTAIFVSSIIGGKLQLPEVSSEKLLFRRDPLGLKGIKGRLAELTFGDYIKTVYVGCVDEVNVEFKATTRNLAPSILESFYFNSRSKFLLSLIVPIWGAVLGVRRLFKRE